MDLQMSTGKKTRGRQKIEIKMIKGENERVVTFSKRRAGIYKKASELITLTGAEVGIVVFSPTGKPFSFGHPSIESIANRFLGQEPPPDGTRAIIETHRQIRINELNQQYNDLSDKLDEERKRGEIMKQKLKGIAREECWWKTPCEELNEEQLLQLLALFQDVQSQVYNAIVERSNGGSSSLLPPLPDSLPMTTPFTSDVNKKDVSDMFLQMEENVSIQFGSSVIAASSPNHNLGSSFQVNVTREEDHLADHFGASSSSRPTHSVGPTPSPIGSQFPSNVSEATVTPTSQPI